MEDKTDSVAEPIRALRLKRRRWLRFSLRTMFLAVTLVACGFGCAAWFLSQWQIVHHRKALIQELLATVGPGRIQYDLWKGDSGEDVVFVDSLSYVRQCLHDGAFFQISMPHTLDPNLVERVAKAFPEAECEVTVETDKVRISIVHH